MSKSLTIKTTEDIFRLRNLLQQISHISFTFSHVNKSYPIEQINEKQGKDVIDVYKNLITDTELVINSYKNLNGYNK